MVRVSIQWTASHNNWTGKEINQELRPNGQNARQVNNRGSNIPPLVTARPHGQTNKQTNKHTNKQQGVKHTSTGHCKKHTNKQTNTQTIRYTQDLCKRKWIL